MRLSGASSSRQAWPRRGRPIGFSARSSRPPRGLRECRGIPWRTRPHRARDGPVRVPPRADVSCRSREIAARRRNDLSAEHGAQRLRLHLLDRAIGHLVERERAEGDPDQPVDLQAEVTKHVADLTVLAFGDLKAEPQIRSLFAFERRSDRSVVNAIDGDAVSKPVEIGLRDAAMRAHAIAPHPLRLRQLQARGPARRHSSTGAGPPFQCRADRR